MCIVSKEPQVKRPHIEIRIHIEYRIVSHFCLVLHTELRCGRIQHRRIVRSEIPHIYSYLRIQRTEPSAVVIQVVIERYRWQRHILRTCVLVHHMVLEIHPRSGYIALYISGQHLYISVMLLWQAV